MNEAETALIKGFFDDDDHFDEEILLWVSLKIESINCIKKARV